MTSVISKKKYHQHQCTIQIPNLQEYYRLCIKTIDMYDMTIVMLKVQYNLHNVGYIAPSALHCVESTTKF